MRFHRAHQKSPLSESDREALARFDPRPTPARRAMGHFVTRLCHLVMRVGNRIEFIGEAVLYEARERPEGLLTYSNHVSLFDDPLLIACLTEARWETHRWIAVDAHNFFGSELKAAIFNSGKCVPVVRGAGPQQMGVEFLAERLREGDWVHIFPEGTRSRKEGARLRRPFKTGIAHLIRASRPLLLPFHHVGMDDILPIGAALPRLGREVEVRFGELESSSQGLSERPIEAIIGHCEERLAALEAEALGSGQI